MSLRDDIQRIFEREGEDEKAIDELLKWARGHPERFEALNEWGQRKIEVFDNQLEASRERDEKASDALHELAEEASNIAEKRANVRALIQEAEEEGHEEILVERRERLRELIAQLDKLKERIESLETREAKAKVRARDALEEKRAWIERKIIFREKWEKAKSRLAEDDKAEWEDFMANGHPLNFGKGAKAEAAIAVVKFDCVVTSTFRPTVISVSSASSNHGPNVNPGRAVDLAGSKMTQYQQDVFNRRKGDGSLLELFGPINTVALKFGSPIGLVEGDFNENLHDTHVHVAVQG